MTAEIDIHEQRIGGPVKIDNFKKKIIFTSRGGVPV